MKKKVQKKEVAHWHIGECDPNSRIGIKGVTVEQFFSCCKRLELKYRPCTKFRRRKL